MLRDRKLNIAPAIKKQVRRRIEAGHSEALRHATTTPNRSRLFAVNMRDQRGRLLCGHAGQSDEQYSARSICGRLSARYVQMLFGVRAASVHVPMPKTCLGIRTQPLNAHAHCTAAAHLGEFRTETVMYRCVIFGISRSCYP